MSGDKLETKPGSHRLETKSGSHRLETKPDSSEDMPRPSFGSVDQKSKDWIAWLQKNGLNMVTRKKWLELPGGRLETKRGKFLAIEDAPSEAAKKVDSQVNGGMAG